MMEQKNFENIEMDGPVFKWVYEGIQARHERTIKRLILALIIAIALIFASNAIWLYAWMQYDYSSDTVTVEGTDGDGREPELIQEELDEEERNNE